MPYQGDEKKITIFPFLAPLTFLAGATLCLPAAFISGTLENKKQRPFPITTRDVPPLCASKISIQHHP
jgi:hypothetical protein